VVWLSRIALAVIILVALVLLVVLYEFYELDFSGIS
jgi:hypothetical protein